jgi:hypothetical protein
MSLGFGVVLLLGWFSELNSKSITQSWAFHSRRPTHTSSVGSSDRKKPGPGYFRVEQGGLSPPGSIRDNFVVPSFLVLARVERVRYTALLRQRKHQAIHGFHFFRYSSVVGPICMRRPPLQIMGDGPKTSSND